MHDLFSSAAATYPVAPVERQSHDHAADGIDLMIVNTGDVTGDHPADVDLALIELARRYRAFSRHPIHFVTGDLNASFRAQSYATGQGDDRTLIPHWRDWAI